MLPEDEVSIHRTDCINVINIPEDDRARLIDAEWDVEEGKQTGYIQQKLRYMQITELVSWLTYLRY